MIDLIFLWFGAGNLDVDWYYDTGRGRQRSILPSPHNRAIQDWWTLWSTCINILERFYFR